MNKLVEFFVKHHIWANAIIVLTLIFGGLSFYSMDRAFFPEQEPTTITINTFYPGASPEEMEEGITIKIEEALKGIAEVDELTSNSSENSSLVTILAFEGTNMEELLQEVKNAVDGISSWPAGAEQPIIYRAKTSRMSGRAAYLALTGSNDLFELKKLSEDIEKDFLASGFISEVKLSGYPDIEYSIEVQEDELLRFGLTFNQVVLAVQSNNRDLSAGTIKSSKEEFVIRSKIKSTDVRDLENIVLRSSVNGEYILLGEVADVKFQFADVPNKTKMDSEQSVVIEVSRRYGEDLKKISVFLEGYMVDFNAKHNDFKLTKTFMFYDLLNQRIDMLMNNGIMGLVLVLIVLGLFLNLRLSIWVAFGIPFSFLGMFIIGSFYGMTVNMISLFGMILVVGILVDDGIVIAENIYSHYERGKSPFRAAIDGTQEVISAVFTSVLTTILAFSVLFFIEGMERMAEMAFVVIAALAFSLIEAFLVLPAHLSSKKVLNSQGKKGGLRYKINGFIDWMRDKVYGSLLALVMKYRRFTFTLPLVFIVFIFYLVGNKTIPTTFFPSIPFDDFSVEVAFLPGEREAYTQAVLDEMEIAVQEVRIELREKYDQDIIKYVTNNLGVTRNLGENGSHAGHLNVSLDVEGTDVSSFAVAAMVRERIGDYPEAQKFMVGGFNRWGSPVEIALSSKNSTQLKEAIRFFEDELKKLPELKDVKTNNSAGKREVLLKLKPKAYMLGFNTSDIVSQIRQGFYGQEAQRLIVGTDEARVWVRYPEKDRLNFGKLEQMRVKSLTGQEIPIVELVDYTIERGEVSIKHYDGQKEIVITADQTDPYASTPEILASIKEEIYPKLLGAFADISIDDNRGQQRRANKSGGSMGILGLLLILMMTLIIALNFNSVHQALIIITILPVGFASAIIGHGIEGHPVSILSVWGIIALLGVLVNDAVVFVDQFNRNLKNGLQVEAAVVEAGKSRFRPIILTSITTVAGLYPLILEKSFQAQFLVPMAISVAYGVLFGTYFILVFLPSLILAFNDFKRLIQWVWTGSKPSQIEVEPVHIYQQHLSEMLNELEPETND